MRSNSDSARSGRDAFSAAEISDEYVITLRSQPRATMSAKMPIACSTRPCLPYALMSAVYVVAVARTPARTMRS